MSETPEIGLIRRFYELVGRRKLESLIELLDPEVEMVTPEAGLNRPVRGHAALQKMFASYVESFSEFEIEPERILEGGRPHQYLALVRIHIRGRGSGIEFGREPAHLVEIRDGRIARLEVFPNRDRAEAFEAAGLEPPG
jgi:ketosteroid isomerase-like protein